MNTIQDLQKKILYRALKVGYITIFFVVLIIGITSIYEINENMFETQTDIIQSFLDDENQDYENREAIFKMLQANIPEYTINKIIQEKSNLFDVYMGDENISENGKTKMLADIESGKMSKKEADEIILQLYWNTEFIESKKISLLDNIINIENFRFLLFTLLFLAISYVIFFQILNRVFYYIVLWTLFPKKD